MSDPLISIQVQDTMSPALRAQAVGINPPRALVARLGGELKKALQEHFRARDGEGNKHGWPSRHFWSKQVLAQVGPVALSDRDATITIASPELAHKFKGGRITPKAGKKALAIPMNELAYRRGSPREWDRQDLLYIPGRRPFLAGLDLESAGVAIEGHRIPVNGEQQTNVPHIYAVGDVTDRINLTPVAIDEGRALADTVWGGKPRQVDHTLVASAVFSQPELSGVGLTEEQAIERHGAEAIRVHRARFRPMSQALPARDPKVLLKLIVEQASGRVLGCHMVGEHAAEIIQMAAIAIGMGATKADFDRTMALHPSVAEEFVTMPN